MPLLYIHYCSCISPQQSFPVADFTQLKQAKEGKLEVSEPNYEGIPAGMLRRMGKAIRMGVGAALPLLKQTAVDGIIIGTANGGMEDCILFLNQIIDYEEGRLTPGNFVGSTPNAIAAQLGMMTRNKGYNATHVQSGLSFENALLDAAMLLKEKKEGQYLVGGLDEISSYNFNIDWLAGWVNKEEPTVENFYQSEADGTIAGEGAAMFMVSNESQSAMMQLDAMHFFHSDHESEVGEQLKNFLANQPSQPDLFLSGENGDRRFKPFAEAAEGVVPETATVARYKHLCGEYATSSAFALWLCCEIFKIERLDEKLLKREGKSGKIESILIYNQYKKTQHSFMLVSAAKMHT